MEKRVVLFLVFSLAIIFGYDFLMKQLGLIPVDSSESQNQAEQQIEKFSSESPELSASDGQDGNVGKLDIEGLEDSTPSASSESEEIIETPLFQAKISNRGVEIRSWSLKKYLTQNSDDPQPIEMVYSEGHFAGPLALQTGDAELNTTLRESLFEVKRDFDVLDSSHPIGHLVYSFRSPDGGIWIKKQFTFHYDSYLVDVAITSQGLSQEIEVLLGTNFGVVEWGQGFIGLVGPAWMIGDTLEKETPENELTRTGDVRWAALQDKYFISVIIPKEATGVTAKKEVEGVTSAGVQFPLSRGETTLSFQLFAGPKQFELLKSFGIGLENTIDFGWFIYGTWRIVEYVAKPLFYVLLFLYDYTQNYGVSIILLTVLIKLLFVPLQYKSYKSMQGMQKIQPKVAVLQAKFKDDREKLNKELIKLYKEHKVNPVGGCLPMVLQMPAFISLFNILYMTVDLRQAPFFLWITDLSIQDPYYVLPVLMGVSMVVQQKIMPTTMDPTQAKMMLLLPVFLTFLFVTFPAGLVLYWLTNNVLTITQQFVTDRFVLKRHIVEAVAGDEKVPSKEEKESNKGSKKKKGEAE